MNKEEYKKEVFTWLEIAGKQPGQEMINLSNKLIREEYLELGEAVALKDKTKIVDALIDITWVLYNELFAVTEKFRGTAMLKEYVKNKINNHIESYIPEMLEKHSIDIGLFNIYEKAVRDSNYSKFCLTYPEHKNTQRAYLSGKHFDKLDTFIECEIAIKIDNIHFPVIQKNTGKILKSINYKPAEELFKLYSDGKTFQ